MRQLSHIPPLLFLLGVLCSACVPSPVKNVTNAQFERTSPQKGIILGSYNSDLWYQSVGDGGKTTGAIMLGETERTLGTPPWFPDWVDEGLPNRARLFAVELPEGTYEFLKRDDVHVEKMPPVRFSVEGGTMSYLGSFRFEYCQGVVAYRRATLGYDLFVEDHFERDMDLLKRRYPALKTSLIEKQVLLGHWRWRDPLRGLFGQTEPRDWGTCISR